ncbi:MAG: hypothetical protein AAFR58_08820 [Cyanobacteria bacterium J06627_28]
MNWWQKGVAVGASGSAIAALTVTFLLAHQSPGCACKPDTHGQYLNPILRAQQAFHLESGRLAKQNTLENWWAISLLEFSRNHHYFVETEPGPESESVSEIAYAYAIPHDPNFYPKVGPFRGKPEPTYYSVVGAIAYDEITSDYRQIRCASPTAIDEPVAQPRFVSGRFYCAANSVELGD